MTSFLVTLIVFNIIDAIGFIVRVKRCKPFQDFELRLYPLAWFFYQKPINSDEWEEDV